MKNAGSGKFIWYLNRLKSMSAIEILHRVDEQIKRKQDLLSPPKISGIYFDLPKIPGLREGLNNSPHAENYIKSIRPHYEKIQNGEFEFLGSEWKNNSETKWHFDPISGNIRNNDKFCFAIDYRHDKKYGDVKYIWELNRLQYLQDFAALAFFSQDKEIIKFVIAELASWIDNNPPYLGVNWASGIELSLRLLSIFIVTTFLKEHINPDLHEKICNMIEAHTLWLERYPSRFSSANNHLLAEALGLFLVGTFCPDLANAKQRQSKAWQILSDETGKQILADGVGAEQAIAYTAFSLEILLTACYIAEIAQIKVPDHYKNRIGLEAEYLLWFTDKSGNQPRIGDDDSGKTLGFCENGNYVSSILGSVAALLERPDLTPPALHFAFRNILFGFSGNKAKSPLGIRTFNAGGYTICRYYSKFDREILFAIDHGNLGYLSIAAHGHADALAIWLHIDGQPILVDAGNYIYHGDDKLREFFRSTAAHNTLCLERSNSSISSGNFNWSHKAKAKLIASEYGDDFIKIECEHDGYAKRFATIHNRCIKASSSGFSVEDKLLGGRQNYVEIGFLLNPDLQIEQQERQIILSKNGVNLLAISNISPLKIALRDSLYSPAFGKKETAKQLVFSGILKPDDKSITKFEFIA